MKTNDFKRIKRTSVRAEVFEQLRDNVLRGTWKPGTKIPSENALRLALGVSRVSIREGIQRLVSLGILETRHGEGTFVRTYNGEVYLNELLPMLALEKTGIFQVLEYRRVMEKGTIALVVEKAGEAEIDELERHYARMVESTNDVRAFAMEDLEFHLALAKATGNPIIIKVNDIIRSILSVSMENIVESLGVTDGLTYHKQILDAIKARDSARAEALMEEHLVRTIERLQRQTGATRE
ncbi:MAG TPA: FadR/GntR family transcriptional regulator [Spirochaetia bacterium]|nr:FadR/GntR family transcriptional regulator [Spirochaetia bacterium]